MKKIQIILIVFSLAFASCANVDLDEKPSDLLNPITFFTTIDDFDAALTGAFKSLYKPYEGFDFDYPFTMTAGAEDIAVVVTRDFHALDDFTATGNQEGIVTLWPVLYQCISNTNSIIGNLDNGNTIPKNRLDEIEGQAKFLRALSYFYLVRWFGEVQLTTLENQKDILTLKQSTEAEIYASIISNLKDAEIKLPSTFSEKGRPTKGAAKALLAKVYLTMAGWPIEDASYYAKAKDKAAEVMTMGYDLEPNFADLWKQEKKLSNPEFIFTFYGSATAEGSSASHLHLSTRAATGGEKGWGDFFSEARFYNIFPDGPRKEASFTTNFADGSDWISTGSQPHIAKYRDAGEIFDDEHGSGFLPILRYADVLLIYAEAANMAEGSPSANALEAINKVRRRAMGLDINTPAPAVDLSAGMSQTDFDTAVISERNWELAFELNRWFDLVRKKMVVQVNQSLHPNVSVNNRLLPKPTAQLIPGILDQNPGY